MFETTNQAIVYDTVLIISYIWLVVYLPLRKIWKSVGIILPNICKNKNVPNHQPDIKCGVFLQLFPSTNSGTHFAKCFPSILGYQQGFSSHCSSQFKNESAILAEWYRCIPCTYIVCILIICIEYNIYNNIYVYIIIITIIIIVIIIIYNIITYI